MGKCGGEVKGLFVCVHWWLGEGRRGRRGGEEVRR